MEYAKAAEESVRYAEWSIYWIKYKNCQYASTVPYCRPLTLTSHWASYCWSNINPFISSKICTFGVVVANPNCPKTVGNKCSAGEQRGQHGGSADWEKDRWIAKWCYGDDRNKCADKEGWSKWSKVELVVFAFA